MRKDKRTFYNADARVTYAFRRVCEGHGRLRKDPRAKRKSGGHEFTGAVRPFMFVSRAGFSPARSLFSEGFRGLFSVPPGRHQTEPCLRRKIENFVKEITVAELPISQLVVACSPAGFAVHQSIGAETHVDWRLAQDAELLALAL